MTSRAEICYPPLRIRARYSCLLESTLLFLQLILSFPLGCHRQCAIGLASLGALLIRVNALFVSYFCDVLYTTAFSSSGDMNC